MNKPGKNKSIDFSGPEKEAESPLCSPDSLTSDSSQNPRNDGAFAGLSSGEIALIHSVRTVLKSFDALEPTEESRKRILSQVQEEIEKEKPLNRKDSLSWTEIRKSLSRYFPVGFRENSRSGLFISSPEKKWGRIFAAGGISIGATFALMMLFFFKPAAGPEQPAIILEEKKVSASGAYLKDEIYPDDKKAPTIVSGEAFYVYENQRYRVQRGAVIAEKKVEFTEKSRLNTQMAMIVAKPGSRLWIGNKGFSEIVELQYGIIDADVSAVQDKFFAVQTPHGILEVLGTRFIVRTDSLRTEIRVKNGIVLARSASMMKILRSGDRIYLDSEPYEDISKTVKTRKPPAQAFQKNVYADDIGSIALLADRYRRAGELTDAALLYRRVAFYTGHGNLAEEALMQLALIHFEEGKSRKALSVLDEADLRFDDGILKPERVAIAVRIHLKNNHFNAAYKAIEKQDGGRESLELQILRLAVAEAVLEQDPKKALDLLSGLEPDMIPDDLMSEASGLGERARMLIE